jgi:lysozyme
MKTRLTFWTIYLFAIVFMYLGSIPSTLEKSEVGITQSTIYLIKQFEGIRHSAYDDGFGNMTIGVGHLIKASEPHLHYATLKMHEIQHLLKQDLEPCEAFLRTGVGTPLNQSQFDALMSVCFNIGLDKFKDSKIVRYLNQGDIQKAGDAILNWNKPSVLEARRKQERKLFLSKI